MAKDIRECLLEQVGKFLGNLLQIGIVTVIAPDSAALQVDKYDTPIPAEYRWLLLNFGGCYLAEPWIFTLKELEEAYPIFQEAYEDYMSEYDHAPPISSVVFPG